MKTLPFYKRLALMLCMGAFLIPTAGAASDSLTPDTTPPVLELSMDGEILTVSAADAHSGVAVIFVNEASFSGSAGTVLRIPLRSYCHLETLSLYARDYAGNATDLTVIHNPFYAQTPGVVVLNTQSPSPAEAAVLLGGGDETPSAANQAAGQADSQGITQSQAPAAGSDASGWTPASSDAQNTSSLTPDGTGSVLDNVTDQDGKEFFTLETPDGFVYYLVIDRTKSGENVYLLNTVKESDLLPLAEGNSSQVNQSQGFGASESEPTPTPEPEPETPKSGGNSLLLILAVMFIVGGLGYYFKIWKPKHSAAARTQAADAAPSEYDFEDEDEDEREEDEAPDDAFAFLDELEETPQEDPAESPWEEAEQDSFPPEGGD